MVTGEAVLLYIDQYVVSASYCIPMDELEQAIQWAEEMFFAECDPGNSELVFIRVPSSSQYGQFPLWCCSPNSMHCYVPVALGKLGRQVPRQERLSKAKALTEGIFDRANVWGRLSIITYPPKSCVCYDFSPLS